MQRHGTDDGDRCTRRTPVWQAVDARARRDTNRRWVRRANVHVWVEYALCHGTVSDRDGDHERRRPGGRGRGGQREQYQCTSGSVALGRVCSRVSFRRRRLSLRRPRQRRAGRPCMWVSCTPHSRGAPPPRLFISSCDPLHVSHRRGLRAEIPGAMDTSLSASARLVDTARADSHTLRTLTPSTASPFCIPLFIARSSGKTG